jgi:hypothetical protein
MVLCDPLGAYFVFEKASYMHSTALIKQVTEPQNIYWLFSSSAQAISTFVAFLLTGFALVHTMMDSIQQKDDTLEEIHSQLIRIYYSRIKWLSSLTGLAIVSSLATVYLNGLSLPYFDLFVAFTSIVNLASIIGGILFVISIINPDKYRNVARDLIKEERDTLTPTGTPVLEGDFIRQFIKLEVILRNIIQRRSQDLASHSGPRMALSVRQMADALYHNELIDNNLLEELLRVNKYRNLVFHGHVSNVDKAMLDKLNKVIDRIENIN